MFTEILSKKELLKAIKESGYTQPTPIQEQAIPAILKGNDLLASAQTGTGKTAAFILPTLELLTQRSALPGRGPRAVILAPTRELAMQIATQSSKYGKYLSQMKTVCVYGGVPYPVQKKQLSGHYEVLVATPGRLLDYLDRGLINFSRTELFILDEADRMLDMGFIEDVEAIAAAIPQRHQTLLFSATLKGAVLKLSERLLSNPQKIQVAAEQERHDHIEQRLHAVDGLDHKYRLLESILKNDQMNQALIFTATKSQADTLAEKLIDLGYSAAALHGDMRQRERSKTLMRLREGKIRILIATDVAARGIDVQTISHVINFDLPMSTEDYVHRIGRTGRAGATGIALSFASARDMHLVRRIEQFTGQVIVPHVIAGLEPSQRLSHTSRFKRNKGSQRFFRRK